MDFSLLVRALRRTPSKILHIGANKGQEAATYAKNGVIGYHVEAIPDMFDILKRTCEPLKDQEPLNYCLHEDNREVEFNIASNSAASSSILGLGRHAVSHPSVTYSSKIRIRTKTVDQLIGEAVLPDDIDVAVLDVQGAEMHVLRGAGDLLRSSHLIGLVTEVSPDPLYEGGATYLQLCNFLEPLGYYTKSVEFNEYGWGNALFCKRWWKLSENETPPFLQTKKVETKGRNIAPEGTCSQSSAYPTKASLPANLAVEGSRGIEYSFHTDKEAQPWWMLDLQRSRKFDEIICFNRMDLCSERADDIVISISDDGRSWKPIWRNVERFGGIDGKPLRVSRPGERARYIKITGGMNTYLHLNKIEVYDWDSPET